MRRLGLSILGTALALAVVTGWVLAKAHPSAEAVRLRNALLITDVQGIDFDWRPERAPAGFLQETKPAPALIATRAREIAAKAGPGDFEVAKALASHLTDHALDGPPVQSLDAEANYRAIIEDGRGYCADFIDAFIALAHSAGIPVRAWAFSFDGFGGRGHIVAEIFDRQRGRWVMFDVFNNVHPVDPVTGEPLGALETRTRLLADPPRVTFSRIGSGRLGFAVEARLLAYYRRGLDEWYLWFGNNVVSRGAEPLVRAASRIGEPVGELQAIALGVYPRIVPLRTVENASRVERLHVLGTRLIGAAVLAGLLSLALVVQIGVFLLRRRGARVAAQTAVQP